MRSEYLGGVVMFGIMFTIAMIEILLTKKIKAFQVSSRGANIGASGLLGGELSSLAVQGSGSSAMKACEEAHKGNKKAIKKCKENLQEAETGGSALSTEQRRLLTQSRQ